MSRLKLDSATGSIDLAWLLVILFFITTVISLRPTTSGVKPARPATGKAVVIGLSPRGEATLIDGGDHALMGPISGWLGPLCDSEPVAVELRCADEMNHRDCKAAVGGVVRQAPKCSYGY
jgi:hypothetical protein